VQVLHLRALPTINVLISLHFAPFIAYCTQHNSIIQCLGLRKKDDYILNHEMDQKKDLGLGGCSKLL
jgi:hypothetical protein